MSVLSRMALIGAKRDPISPGEWADGWPHRLEGNFCVNCGGSPLFHYALFPKPRDTPIYDRLIRGLTRRH